MFKTVANIAQYNNATSTISNKVLCNANYYVTPCTSHITVSGHIKYCGGHIPQKRNMSMFGGERAATEI